MKIKSRRVILWLVVIGLAGWLVGSLFLISYANMWVQDKEPKDKSRQIAEEQALCGEVEFQKKLGTEPMDEVRALKRLAFFYLEGKNYAGARDTFLRAERVLSRVGDTAVNNIERLRLKRMAAMAMANCTMYEEAQPIFNQAERLSNHLFTQDKENFKLAQAELLNDEGVFYYLWANSTKSKHRREAKFDLARSYFERALKSLAESNSKDGLIETVKVNLQQVDLEKLFASHSNS